MSDNYNERNRNRKKKSRYERIGFYTSLSICLIAVSMAVYSTYSNISETDPAKKVVETTVAIRQVNEPVTGVTEIITQPQEETQVTAVAQTYEPIEQVPTEVSQEDTRNALQTMLSTDLSLTYPLDSNNIIREYSEKTTYYKTLNVWKPHLGVDFAGELGDNVYSKPWSVRAKSLVNRI